jgi:ribosomal protein L10
MPSKDNVEQIKIIQEKIDRAKSLVIVDYSGSTVNDLNYPTQYLKRSRWRNVCHQKHPN